MNRKPLYELPRNTPLRIALEDGTLAAAKFHHVDGMYSFCTLTDDRHEDGSAKVFHIKAWTMLEPLTGEEREGKQVYIISENQAENDL